MLQTVPGGGGLPNKMTGKLVVSLRGVNCRFWSQGVRDRKSVYLPIKVSLTAVDKEIYKKCSGVCFSMVSYKGGGVSLALISRSPLRLVFTSDRVGVGVVSEVVRTLMTK